MLAYILRATYISFAIEFRSYLFSITVLKIMIIPTSVIVTGHTLERPVIKKICPLIKNVLSMPIRHVLK